MNFSFCTLRNIFDRLLKRVGRGAAVVGTVTVADPTVAGQHKTKDLTHKTKDSSSSHVKLTHCPATPAVSVTPGPLNRCDLK